MAKLSSINKNNKRIKLVNKYYKKRQNLKKIIMNKNLSLEERFIALNDGVRGVVIIDGRKPHSILFDAEFLGILESFCCALNLSSKDKFLFIIIFFKFCLFL